MPNKAVPVHVEKGEHGGLFLFLFFFIFIFTVIKVRSQESEGPFAPLICFAHFTRFEVVEDYASPPCDEKR